MKIGLDRVRVTVAGVLVAIAGLAVVTPGALAGDDENHGSATKAVRPAPAAVRREAPKAEAPKGTSKEEAPAEKAGAEKPASEKPAAEKGTKATKAGESSETMTAEAALSALQEGNARWLNGKCEHPNTDGARRKKVSEEGQKPFATILTCADSRVPAERVFDRGVGELFVVRVAGNVVSGTEAGTIEYGVEHLRTPVIVVMGHSKCGAVKAACGGEKVGGNIDGLLEEIRPAVQRAKSACAGCDENALVDAAIKENVWQSIYDLMKTSPMVAGAVKEGKVKIVGAICDISTGKVEFLGEHPWQEPLVQALSGKGAEAVAQGAEKDAH